MPDGLYITTAIDYVNGVPHLGHAYEKVVTDVIARAHRSLGRPAFFLTGLDEHGQKVQQAAHAAGLAPQDYCDRLAVEWRGLTRALGLSNDDFIRTTEPRHQQVVQAILTKLHGEGHFYQALYEGWYSTKEETFLTDKDRLPDGAFPAHYGEVIRLSETNWYFRLKEHQAWLLDHIENHPDFIQPDSRRNEVLGFLRSQELEDLSISRPRARLAWGIPLPFDPACVTYVWFDALVNYLTVPVALGDPLVTAALGLPGREDAPALWPAVHVIGKDIVKFHAVYWPIMLRAMGLPLPRHLLVHGWWQKDGQKLSKSTGNVVDPRAVIAEWGLDAFRYYVVRELDLGPDGNWTDAGFAARHQAELANGLGNLVNRSLSMLRRYRGGAVPPRSSELARSAGETACRVQGHLTAFRLQTALVAIWELITRANQYVDQTAPFRLAKDPAQTARLDEVLYNLAETCRVLAVLLWPFIPGTAEKIFAQLGLGGAPDRFDLAQWGGLAPGHVIGEPQPLFPRKDLAPA
jgi:methionyl-tRNA synthetase